VVAISIVIITTLVIVVFGLWKLKKRGKFISKKCKILMANCFSIFYQLSVS